MKCPMKFADGSRKASQEACEREECAWWIGDVDGKDISQCSMKLSSVMSIASVAVNAVAFGVELEKEE